MKEKMNIPLEQFEDIRSRESKDREYNGQKK